jgi:predicted amidohydrolase
MRVLLAELAPAPGEVDRNLARVASVLADRPVDLAVFPELFLSGYRVGDAFHRLALRTGDAVHRRLAEISAARNVTIAVGAPVASAARPGEVENAVVVTGPAGPVGSQAKRFLPTYGPFEEGALFTPTDRSESFPIGGRPVGFQVCYDAFFPEVSRSLALGGAELFVVSSAAPVTSTRLFEKVLPARAVENATPLVYVNRVGVEDGIVFGGGSVALDARGEPLDVEWGPAPSGAQEERVGVVELDLDAAARWRPFRPVLRDVASRPPT